MQVKDIQAKALPILKRRAVRRAGVFGSSARGEAGARDVDLVEYSTIKPRLRERILADEVTIL